MCDNTTLCYPGTNCTGNFTHFECGPCPPGYYGNATGIDGCIGNYYFNYDHSRY